MTTSKNILRVNGPLCWESTGNPWIPLTKASDAERWCFLWSAPEVTLSKQSRRRWFETSLRSLWRHCNEWYILRLNNLCPIGSVDTGQTSAICNVWWRLGTEMCFFHAWWRHQMETFSASLAICAGNSPVTGEFPAQRPVTRCFGVFFDLRLNKWLSKQWWGRWFETPSCPLWRHCNVYVLLLIHLDLDYGMSMSGIPSGWAIFIP